MGQEVQTHLEKVTQNAAVKDNNVTPSLKEQQAHQKKQMETRAQAKTGQEPTHLEFDTPYKPGVREATITKKDVDDVTLTAKDGSGSIYVHGKMMDVKFPDGKTMQYELTPEERSNFAVANGSRNADINFKPADANGQYHVEPHVWTEGRMAGTMDLIKLAYKQAKE